MEIILPLRISNNLAVVEAICLQLDGLDVESIYTFAYILRLYPALLSLKKIQEHYAKVERRLGNVDGVIYLHLITSNIHEKEILQMPNMNINEWKNCGGTLYSSISLWDVYFLPYRLPLMNCLVGAVKKLIPRMKKFTSNI